MENNYSFSKKFVEGEAVSNFWNLAYYGITSLNSFVIIYFLSVYEFGFYQLILSVVAIAESLERIGRLFIIFLNYKPTYFIFINFSTERPV